ncbi:unnamed protein product, partial [Ectocarpus sp. 6 AP-2014]
TKKLTTKGNRGGRSKTPKEKRRGDGGKARGTGHSARISEETSLAGWWSLFSPTRFSRSFPASTTFLGIVCVWFDQGFPRYQGAREVQRNPRRVEKTDNER